MNRDFWQEPASSRIWDYLLGGKDNFQADRELSTALVREVPALAATPRAVRAFVGRAVTLLASAGIDQIIDIGCGIPTSANVHEFAQRINPRAHVVYVDNDPLVLSHARALMASHPDGRTEVINGDLTNPDAILASTVMDDTIDLTRPVALVLSAVLHDIPDTHQPQQAVKHLVQALAPGSRVVLSHLTADHLTPDSARRLTKIATASGYGPLCLRSRTEVARFLEGLDLLDPGVVDIEQWRPDRSLLGGSSPTMCYAAVGRV